MFRVYCHLCLGKLLLILSVGRQRKIIPKSTNAFRVPMNVLSFSSTEITSGTAVILRIKSISLKGIQAYCASLSVLPLLKAQEGLYQDHHSCISQVFDSSASHTSEKKIFQRWVIALKFLIYHISLRTRKSRGNYFMANQNQWRFCQYWGVCVLYSKNRMIWRSMEPNIYHPILSAKGLYTIIFPVSNDSIFF